LEQTTRDLLPDIRKQRLEADASGVLEAWGEVSTLPLEASAVPSKDIAARDRAIVKRLLTAGTHTVAVLGGGHDLADELKRRAPGGEYLRVEVTRYIHTDVR